MLLFHSKVLAGFLYFYYRHRYKYSSYCVLCIACVWVCILCWICVFMSLISLIVSLQSSVFRQLHRFANKFMCILSHSLRIRNFQNISSECIHNTHDCMYCSFVAAVIVHCHTQMQTSKCIYSIHYMYYLFESPFRLYFPSFRLCGIMRATNVNVLFRTIEMMFSVSTWSNNVARMAYWYTFRKETMPWFDIWSIFWRYGIRNS